MKKSELKIKRGDHVEYTKDDGTKFLTVARTDPQKLSGHTWVIWLSGISGCVMLSRCKVATIQPAGS